ncbi:hypothetical protein B0J11DRAFT_63110 [Dendryphion nanum]|uniref:Uncharacterized protein n=1 Tax=Dendryphion nanum TaxID=256645 RepID=A0A9P9IHH6_9PLEO|nr:hypothetical protein B0J11DRAFT_63110 [Dendryphion nanum]
MRYTQEILGAQDTHRFTLGLTLCGLLMRYGSLAGLGWLDSHHLISSRTHIYWFQQYCRMAFGNSSPLKCILFTFRSSKQRSTILFTGLFDLLLDLLGLDVAVVLVTTLSVPVFI